jgi:hypothetical protein
LDGYFVVVFEDFLRNMILHGCKVPSHFYFPSYQIDTYKDNSMPSSTMGCQQVGVDMLDNKFEIVLVDTLSLGASKPNRVPANPIPTSYTY